MSDEFKPPHDTRESALDAGLQALHQAVLAQPVPATLQAAALRLQAAQQRAAQQRHWGGMAAGVLLAFGLGWLAHGRMDGGAAGYAASRPAHDFVRQAGLAYTVYQPEKRHPVEVAASEQAHLLQWLSKRLGRSLKIPDLEPQGFALVGGRLLPGEAGPRAQFMFQNSEGQRITLDLGALQAGATADVQATQFRLEPDGPVPSFYWTEQGFGYALSGQVERTVLLALADSVYRQIN